MANINTNKHLNRRTFLKSSSAAIALPFLSAMLPARGKASEPIINPKRFMAINSGLGYHSEYFIPAESGKNYTPSKYLELVKSHIKNLTVFSGLSHPNQNGANGHASGLTWLTSAQRPGLAGFKNTISLDQLIAKKVGHLTRFPYLNISQHHGSLSWTANGVNIPSETNSVKLFQKLFVNGTLKEVQNEMKRIERGQSILDTIVKPAKKLDKSLGHEDKQKFAEYLSSIRYLEKRLSQNADWVQKPKPKVDFTIKNEPQKQSVIEKLNLTFDLVHLALETDSTRVVTLNIGGMNAVPSDVPGVEHDWHNLSHHGKDPKKIAELSLIEIEKFKAFNKFLNKMTASITDNSSLLDKTSILFGSNLGNASSHSWRNLPIIVAGGNFKHGSHIAHDLKNNTAFANLFVQIGQKMGLEIDSFGSSTATSIKGFA